MRGAQIAWLKHTLSSSHPHLVWQSSLRAALTIGVPFFIGSATGFLPEAMWMSFAAMFFTASEKPGVLYQQTVRKVVFVAPCAFCSFFSGYISDITTWVHFVFLVVVAFFAGTLATWSQYFSTAAMQVMMITSMVTGMSDRPYWRYAIFFLMGAGLYAIGVIIQGIITQRVSEVSVLNTGITTLAKNCRQRAKRDSSQSRMENEQETSNFAAAFAQAAVPDLMFGRYREVLQALDQTYAQALLMDTPSDLLTLASALESLLQGNVKYTDLAAFPTLHRAYERYISSDDHSNREALLPETNALEIAHGKRWTSFALSSGVRLALCFSIGMLIGFLLPIDHLFWVATTVAMVMTPNMSAVVGRAVQRIVGAFVGVGLATVILWLDNSSFWLASWITIMAFALPWIGSASGVYKQFFMVPIVLFFGDIIIPGPHDPHYYGSERLLATVIAAIIIYVFGYLVWPKVREPEFQEYFVPLYKALTDYATLVQASGASLHTTFVQRERVYKQLSSFIQKLRVAVAEPPPTSNIAERWIPVAMSAAAMCDAATTYMEDSHNLDATGDSLDLATENLSKRVAFASSTV
ncbi:FUSC family protein [Actinomycetaceae bacterium WB03_NA08]|uniref:FUSC family protein n=1 Tax=Scrofimicrobium canadense TaxID=2652290 RepID=A0A6N7W5X2_9ACTO|nr:FUSC family protein [Scrofimicrobium canadense]MSS83893.1 FUSC family protein [Scrofimicrobium canadense]